MTATGGSRFFFVHVMKAGGSSLREQLYANFAPGEVYPVAGVDGSGDAWLIEYLLGQPAERLARFRAFAGHFPYVVADLLGEDVRTFSLLRHPVDRTISYLEDSKRRHEQHHDLALEEIYDDPFTFPCLLRDHQTKIFSMTEEDKLESYLDVIEVDDRRLALAKANLERVEVLGVHERYGEFIEELQSRFGWRLGDLPNRLVSGNDSPAPDALRRRIEADNAADFELYEHACQLVERRHGKRTA